MQEAKENKKFYPFSIYQDFESHTAASSVNKLKGEFASKKRGRNSEIVVSKKTFLLRNKKVRHE